MQASDIQPRTVPRHLAIIMDGNNRWARREGYPGVAGHRAGAEVVREIVSACESRGIRYLTLFAFSSENWGRSRAEVRALLALLSRYLRNEVAKLASDGVRLRVIGRRDRFSPRLQRLMAKVEETTAAGDRATLTLALDYGGRWDVTQVTQSIARDVASGKMLPDDINEDTISQRLATAELPDPDLCIRTAGETVENEYVNINLADYKLNAQYTLIYNPFEIQDNIKIEDDILKIKVNSNGIYDILVNIDNELYVFRIYEPLINISNYTIEII